MDWQTLTALAIVALSALLLLRALFKRAKRPSCGSDCACGKEKR